MAELSPSHLQKGLQAALGLSPRDYVRLRRAERFKSEVRSGRSVTDALYEAGYGSGSRLYSDASARLGMTPGAYKRGGAGETVRFSTAASKLGRLLVATTERGLCAVQLGESDAGSKPRCGRTTRAPSCSGTTACCSPRSLRSWPISTGTSPASTCRST